MRRGEIHTIQSLEFSCPAETVWAVLTDPKNYREWYGWPTRLTVTSVEHGFGIGARLKFRSIRNTKVVTRLEHCEILQLSDEMVSEEFRIVPHSGGCTVSYKLEIFDPRSPIADKLSPLALETLRAMRDYAEKIQNERDAENPGFRQSLPGRFLGERMRFSGGSTRMPPHGLLTAAIFTLTLILVLSVSLTFDRSEIVPSSGLSIWESGGVGRSAVEQFSFGSEKSDLELLLGCQGERLTTEEYRYRSLARLETGENAEIILMRYDAYGGLRAYAYQNTALSREHWNADFAALSFPSEATPEQVENALGRPASAIVVRRSGVTVLYFGKLPENADLFSESLRSELVIRLDADEPCAEIGYYNPDGTDNPMEGDRLTNRLRQQFSSVTEYLCDRAAFERILLLPNCTEAQVEQILQPYLIQQDDAGFSVSYSCGNPEDPEGIARNIYVVTYDTQGRAQSVEVRNMKLSSIRRAVLEDLEGLDLAGVGNFARFEELIGILPSAARLVDGELVVLYGASAEDGTYPLRVTVEPTTQRILAFTYTV